MAGEEIYLKWLNSVFDCQLCGKKMYYENKKFFWGKITEHKYWITLYFDSHVQIMAGGKWIVHDGCEVFEELADHTHGLPVCIGSAHSSFYDEPDIKARGYCPVFCTGMPWGHYCQMHIPKSRLRKLQIKQSLEANRFIT